MSCLSLSAAQGCACDDISGPYPCLYPRRLAIARALHSHVAWLSSWKSRYCLPTQLSYPCHRDGI